MLFEKTGRRPALPDNLIGLAGIAGHSGQAEQAARLLGAADGISNALNVRLTPDPRSERDRFITAVRAQIPNSTFAAGRALNCEQAVAEALEVAKLVDKEGKEGESSWGCTKPRLAHAGCKKPLASL